MSTKPEPKPLTIPVLTTLSGRFTLRPFRPEDAPHVHEHVADGTIAATTTLPHPYPDGAGASWIASHGPAAEAGTDLTWAIVTPENDRPIGAIAIHLAPPHQRGEIGYWLATPWWGQGVMTDAARTVVDYGFKALGLHRIQATCLPYNVGSSRVMEKTGMTFEGILRDYVIHRAAHVDIAMYAIVAGREGEPAPAR